MLAVTHTLTSIAIGTHVGLVPLSFALALLFHLFADTLLHWNIYIERHRWPYVWVALDVVGGLLLAYWLVPDRFFQAPVLAAIIGGNLPDITSGLLTLFGKQPSDVDPFHRLHEGLQHETLSPWKGLVWQVVLVVVAVLLL